MQGPYTKTVGLIVPSSDVNIEATYHRFAPPGIAVATNRIALNRLSVKTSFHAGRFPRESCVVLFSPHKFAVFGSGDLNTLYTEQLHTMISVVNAKNIRFIICYFFR